MGAADRVRDRALARPRSGGGGNGFVRCRAQDRCRSKSWGPAVLDAGLEASITIKPTARETSRPLRSGVIAAFQNKNLCRTFAPWHDAREGTCCRWKGIDMARSRNARTALNRLREQRAELDAREAQLREEAAQELGRMLLDCGAETLEAAKLKRLVKQASAIGIDAALERLGASG